MKLNKKPPPKIYMFILKGYNLLYYFFPINQAFSAIVAKVILQTTICGKPLPQIKFILL